MELVEPEKATKNQCSEMIKHFEQKQDEKKVNQYKRRLCEIYDFEQKFLNIQV